MMDRTVSMKQSPGTIDKMRTTAEESAHEKCRRVLSTQKRNAKRVAAGSETVLVDGDALIRAMQRSDRSIDAWAEASQLSAQTIRNYQGSTPDNPWRASKKSLSLLARTLGVSLAELCLNEPEHVEPGEMELAEAASAAFNLSFFGFHPLGPADKDRTIDLSGRWVARASLLPSCTVSPEWSDEYKVDLDQTEASFSGSLRLASKKPVDSPVVPLDCELVGHTFESGNYLAGFYRFDSPSVWLYGFVMMQNFGDRVTGSFVGRNSRLGHAILEGRVEFRRLA